MSKFADLTALNTLAQVPVSAVFVDAATIAVTSPSSAASLAFFVRVRVLPVSAAAAPHTPPDVRPLLLSDNFVTLLPGETRLLTLNAPLPMPTSAARIVVETFNDAVAGRMG